MENCPPNGTGSDQSLPEEAAIYPDSREVERMMAILEEQWSTAGAWNIPYLVLLVAKLVDRITAHHVKQVANLSLAEWRAMAQIVELQPCNATQIAQRALVDPAEVSRALRSLEKRGFIRRYRNPKNCPPSAPMAQI